MHPKNNSYQLHLIDFFENLDPDNPYMRADVSELQGALPNTLLSNKAEWFQTWSQAVKRSKHIVE